MSESNTQSCLSRVHGRWVRLFAKIKYAAASSALSVVTAMTLRSAPAAAQERAGTQSVEIFGGEQFGDNVNAGIGAKYYLVNNLYVDFQARYRYLNRLVSDSNQHLNTAETTLGVGWRF